MVFLLPILFAILALCYTKPVYVMMPLDTVGTNGKLTNSGKTQTYINKIKESGAAGIMIDVWWGIAEQSAKNYNFNAWKEVASMCQNAGLKMQVVASFHRCGGNVNDSCNIPIPSFVLTAARNNDLLYKDQWGNVDEECLSVSADTSSVFNGRNAVEMYYDFINAMLSQLSSYVNSKVLTEVQVGMGPAGELRYPAYQSDKWSFPHVGGFQCWNKHMISSFQSSAKAAGHSDWNSPPTDAGNYNSMPNDTTFFRNGFKTDYGKFFLKWYQQQLIDHADRVLTKVAPLIQGKKVNVAVKIAGIHWLYNHESHAAELTSGYWNCKNCGSNGYKYFAQLFAKHKVIFDFTCLEMGNNHDGEYAMSRPYDLVRQTMDDVYSNGYRYYAGENALQVYNDNSTASSYNNILTQTRYHADQFKGFTYLRADDTLFSSSNYNNFKNFVNNMKNIN